MLYSLPAGVQSAQELKFPDALSIRKHYEPGRMLSSGSPANPATMGFWVKKWGNGANNSHTAKQKDGAGHGMRSSKELSGKTAHAK